MKPREVRKKMEQRGWRVVRWNGDHAVFAHPRRRGKQIVPIDRNQDRHPRANRKLRSLFRRLDRMEGE